MRPNELQLSSEVLEAASPPPSALGLINSSPGVAGAASSTSDLFFARSGSVHSHEHVEQAAALQVGKVRSSARTVSLSVGSRVAVSRCRRRNVWFDVQDLEQEAALASLEADFSYQPDRGASPDTWETRLVSSALSRLVAETRVPVSLPDYHGEELRKRTAGIGRVPVFVKLEDGDEVEHPAMANVARDEHRPMEDSLDALRTIVRVRELLERESAAARAVLLEEEKPAAVAKRLGESVAKVYAQTARAMRNLREALCPLEAM